LTLVCNEGSIGAGYNAVDLYQTKAVRLWGSHVETLDIG